MSSDQFSPWLFSFGGVSSKKLRSHLYTFDNNMSFTTDIPNLDKPSKFVCCVCENWLLIRDYDDVEEAILVNISTREEKQLPPVSTLKEKQFWLPNSNLEKWSGLKTRCVMTTTPIDSGCTVAIFSMSNPPSSPNVLIWHPGDEIWKECSYDCGSTLCDLAIWNGKIIGFCGNGLGVCEVVGDKIEVKIIGGMPPDLNLPGACSQYLVGCEDDIFLVYTVSEGWPKFPELTDVIILRLEKGEWIQIQDIGCNVFLLSKHSQSQSFALPYIGRGRGIYIAACANHPGYFYDMDQKSYIGSSGAYLMEMIYEKQLKEIIHSVRGAYPGYELDAYLLTLRRRYAACPLRKRYEPRAYLLMRRRLSEYFIMTSEMESYGSECDPASSTSNGSWSNMEVFGPSLTELIKAGSLDPLVGGQYWEPIEQVAQILGKKRNNPILIGELSVQKTTVVVGLAKRIAQGDVEQIIEEKQIIILNTSHLIAGECYLPYFKRALEDITNNVILFIDELHELFGAEASDNGIEAAKILKPALSGGKLQWIGATTPDGLKLIGSNSQLEMSFRSVLVPAKPSLFIEKPGELSKMKEHMHKRVFGHDEAIEVIIRAIHHAQVTESKKLNRPRASFMICQPSGVARAEIARALACFYFGSENEVVKFDMRDYKNADSVDQLTKLLCNQTCRVLQFDWIEYAHRDVLDIIHDILEHGCAIDCYGKTIYFMTNVVVMNRVTMGDSRDDHDKPPPPCLSDNVAFLFNKACESGLEMYSTDLNFESGLEMYSTDLDFLARYISPELLNMCDGVIVLKTFSLEDEGLMETVNSFLEGFEKAVEVKLRVTDRFKQRVAREGCERAIDDGEAVMKRLEDEIAKLLKAGEIEKTDFSKLRDDPYGRADREGVSVDIDRDYRDRSLSVVPKAYLFDRACIIRQRGGESSEVPALLDAGKMMREEETVQVDRGEDQKRRLTKMARRRRERRPTRNRPDS